MNILAPKVDETAFYQLVNLINKHQWLGRYSTELLSLWNLCDVIDQRDLLSELIERFKVLGPEEVSDLCQEIVKKTEEWNLNVSKVFFVATADNEVDGSVAGLQKLKNHFKPSSGWGEKNFLPNIVKAARQLKNDTDIILFDDFIGTGKTIERKTRWFIKEIDKRKIKISSLRVCSFAAMNFGLKYLHEQTGIETFVPIVLKKGISDFNDEEISKKKKHLMMQLEEKLNVMYKGLRLSDHSLGYNQSESLYNIREENCPNNVFPIFWWPELTDGQPRETLFRRVR